MGHTEKIAADGHFILIVTSGSQQPVDRQSCPIGSRVLFFFLFFLNPFFFPWFPMLKPLIFWVA